MRIIFLNHDLNNNTGAGRFGLLLLNYLKQEIPDLEYRVLTHDNFLPDKKNKLLFSLLKIRAIFKKYDIIHALDGWPYGIIAALASLGLKRKLIITAVGTGAIQPLYNFWKKPIMVWAYRRADQVVAVSNNTKQEILKIIPNLDIQVINHGVEFEKFQSADWRTKPKIIDGLRPYILSVGSLKKRKGYEYSISAFAEISKKFPNLKYVIVGRGPEYDNLQFLISNFQLKDRVVFWNNLGEDALISLYQNAELFILLPQDIKKDIEGFGLVFLEAAAAGLPVIGTKASSAEDALLDGRNGILAPQKDFNQASDAMVKILSNTELKKSFSQESLKFAKAMNWERVAQQYSSLYHNL